MKKFLLTICFLVLIISKVDAQVACGTCSNSNCKIYGPVTGTSFADASTKLSSGWSTYPDSYRYYLDPDPMIGGGIAKSGPGQFKNCYSITLSSVNSLGIKISSKQFLDPISFTINLYNASDASCSAPISVSRNNGGASSFSNNPEWDNLPAGNYKLCVDVNMQTGSVLTDFMVAYYTGVASTTPTNPNECGTCAVPDCKITHNTTKTNTTNIQSTDYNPSDFYTPSSPVTGKISTCHTLTSNANGTIGVRLTEFLSTPQPAQNIQGCSNAEADAIDLTRKYTLVEKNGTCPGVAVTPNVTNKANSATLFNPEWYGLKANTEYTLCIEVDVNQNPTCKMEKFGLVYYHPASNIPPQPTPLPCGTVGINWRNAANTPSASDRNNCVDKDFSIRANSLSVANQFIAPGFDIEIKGAGANISSVRLKAGIGNYVNGFTNTGNPFSSVTAAYCSPNEDHFVEISATSAGTNATIEIIDHATGAVLSSTPVTVGTFVINIPANTIKGTAVFTGPGISNYSLNQPVVGATTYTGSGSAVFNPKKAGNGTHTISYSWNNGNQDCGTATMQVTIAGCSCTTDNGTQAVKINNATPPATKVYATNSYGLCYNDVFSITTTNANPSVDYGIYIGAPTSNDPSTEAAKFTGDFKLNLNQLSETSTGNTSPVLEYLNTTLFKPVNNTIWWVPISTNTVGMYDPACYNMDYQNESYKVTYLNDIKITATETCASSKVSLKFEGGGPEFITGKKYNVTTNKGSLSAASVSSSGGTIDLTGLSQNDNYFINVTDEIGCTKSYSGTYTCACTAPIITGPSAICDLTTVEYTSNGVLTSSDQSFVGVVASGTTNKFNVSAYKPTTASTNLKLTSTLNGCSTTKDITINPKPTITGNLILCAGATSQLTGSGTAASTNAWLSAATTNATISTTGLVTGATTGNGNSVITYTDNNGCTATRDVTINPRPTISGTLNLCAGATSQLTGSGTASTTNAWLSATTANATISNTGLVTGASTGNGNSVITYTDNKGCTNTATVTVNPIPSFVPTVSDICEGNDPALAYTNLTGNPNQIVFDPNLPSVPSINLPVSSSPIVITGLPNKLSVNTYSGLKVRVENTVTGCKSSDFTLASFKVQATQKPSISSKGTDVSSVTFQWSDLTGLNTQTGANEDNYLVEEFICNSCSTVGTYGIATGTLTYNTSTSKWEYLKNNLQPGDKVFIKVTPKDNSPLATPSCYGSSEFDLTAIPCDAPLITKDLVDVTLCEGKPLVAVPTSFDLEYNTADVTTPATWEILTPGGTWTTLNQTGVYSINGSTNVNTTLNISDIKGLDGTKFRVQLKTATSGGTCNTVSKEALLKVKPLPVMNVIADKSFCPATLVNDPAKTKDFDFKITIAGTPTYTWTSDVQTTGVGTGGTDVNDFASFTTLSPSNDVISTITVTPTLNSCVGEAITFKITVKPTVKPVNFAAVNDFNNVKFTWATSSVLPDYWNIDTAITNINAAQPTLAQYKNVTSPLVTGATTEFTVGGINSTKKAYIIVTPRQDGSKTELFCPASDGFSGIPTSCIKPNKPADPIVTAVCEGAPITVNGVNNDLTANFQWKISTDAGVTWNNVSFTDFANTGTTNILSSQVTKSYMNNALVKVVLTDKQTGQCSEESTPVKLLINVLPNVKLIQPVKTSLCIDDNDVSAFIQPIQGKSPLKVDYTLNNVLSTNQDIANLEIKFSAKSEMNYSLSVTKVIDANNCESSLSGLTSLVSVHKNPTPSFAVSDTIGCYPLKINFTDISGEKFTDVTWDFGTGTNSSKDLGTTSFTYQKQGDYTITYSVINEYGCSGEIVKVDEIHVKNSPIAVISTDRNIVNVYENVVQFNSKLSQNGTFYKWDFGDNSSFSNEPIVKHKYDPNVPGKFKVYLIVSNSTTNATCSDTAVTWIDFPEEVVYFIPNTFTPNGDEFNNTFQPIFTSGFDPQNYSFTIFDRWGQIVFESKNPNVGWDGSYGDKLLGNDTFVWKLGFKEKANDNEHYTTGHVNLVK